MIDAPFALAFTAGLVATVNPCGFAMLPAYLGYFVGLSDADADAAAGGPAMVRRGLVIGAVVSSGFLVVFGIAGVLVTAGLQSVIELLPWAAIAIGVGVAALGVAMLAGYQPVLGLPQMGRARQGRRFSAVFSFGVSYAVASLSCTLPVFLAVVAGAVARTNLAGGVLLFVVYGAGMSLVLMVVTLALAVGWRGLVRWLRRAARHVNRVSGAVLLLAGAYIVWFWLANLADPLSASASVSVVERWSSQLTQLIGDRPALWAGVLGLVTVVAVAYLVRHGRGSARR